jgi:hypothetical protein
MIENIILPRQLQALDATRLTPIVRKLFHSEAVELLDWQIVPIKFDIINLMTSGLFRVIGTAYHNNTLMPWSIVLKIVQQTPMLREEIWKAPDSILYFKRESLAYQSDFRASLPDCIVMPRCFDVTEQPGNIDWLWLEDITDDYPSGWPRERFALTARHLGLFSGRHCSGPPSPDYPWLTMHNLRIGIPFMLEAFQLPRLLHDKATWQQSLVRCAFPTPVDERFLNLLEKSNLLAAMLERLPQTLCHLDANRGNLFARRDKSGHDKTVMIDWAFTGINAVGSDIGSLIWASIPKLVPNSEASRFERLIFDSYLAGLREAGWQGDETIARFGYMAYIFCFLGIFRMGAILNLALDETQQAQLEAKQQCPITELLAEEGRTVYSLMDRGEEALGMLDKVAALL